MSMPEKPRTGLADRVAAAVGSRPGGPGALASRATPQPTPPPRATTQPMPLPARAATQPMPLSVRPLTQPLPLPGRSATQPAPLAAAPAAAAPAPSPELPQMRITTGRGPVIRGWAAARPGTMLNLMPGELHFGGEPSALRTLLGSCVAVTLWHPKRRIGGMCHFLLPSRTRGAADAADGRYGDEAVAALVQAVRAHGTEPGDYVAHLYGGADTMSEASGVKFNVGERNIEQGWALIDSHGFTLDGVDVGDHVPRTVTLTLATGEVHCRRGGAP